MDTLQKLHDLESHLGFDLNRAEGDSVIEYLDDDPMCTDASYLAELFAPFESAPAAANEPEICSISDCGCSKQHYRGWKS